MAGISSSSDRISSLRSHPVTFKSDSIYSDLFRSQENAEKIGQANPLDAAWDAIAELESEMADLSLALPAFPVFENPLLPIMQDTPITPTSLNLPSIDTNLVSQQVNQSNYNNSKTIRQ